METIKEKLQDIFEPEASMKHETYQYVENEKDADAVAWVFVNHHKMKKYPFKFPELRPFECRVEVTHTGLCHTDCSFAEEHYEKQHYPLAPGHEVVGKVIAVGADVKDLKVGDRVGYGGKRESCFQCEFCKMGFDNLCQGPVEQKESYGPKFWGGYSTHIQQPAQWLFKIPEGLPDDKVPPLMCAAVTCYAPLARLAKPGQKVAVLGMGGLGHMGIKIAKAMGCEVAAFTTNEDKVDIVKELGPHKIVVINDENLKKEKMQYHIVINTISVAFDNFDDLLKITRPLGSFVQVGLPAEWNLCKVSAKTLCDAQMNLCGSMFGSRQEVTDTLDFCAKHNILPDCEFYEFDQFPEAYKKLLKGNPIFRNVVKVKDYVKRYALKDFKLTDDDEESESSSSSSASSSGFSVSLSSTPIVVYTFHFVY